jgi:hypothetical protein
MIFFEKNSPFFLLLEDGSVDLSPSASPSVSPKVMPKEMREANR